MCDTPTSQAPSPPLGTTREYAARRCASCLERRRGAAARARIGGSLSQLASPRAGFGRSGPWVHAPPKYRRVQTSGGGACRERRTDRAASRHNASPKAQRTGVPASARPTTPPSRRGGPWHSSLARCATPASPPVSRSCLLSPRRHLRARASRAGSAPRFARSQCSPGQQKPDHP